MGRRPELKTVEFLVWIILGDPQLNLAYLKPPETARPGPFHSVGAPIGGRTLVRGSIPPGVSFLAFLNEPLILRVSGGSTASRSNAVQRDTSC